MEVLLSIVILSGLAGAYQNDVISLMQFVLLVMITLIGLSILALILSTKDFNKRK